MRRFIYGKAFIDLTGQKYGRLTVIKQAPHKNGRTAWYCNCDCGTENYICTGNDLRQGKIVSCGCKKKERFREFGKMSKVDIVGKRYGQLIVIEDSGKRSAGGGIIWKCQCDCGNYAYATKSALDSKQTVSCGCYRKTVLLKDCIGKRFGKLVVIDKDFDLNRVPHTMWICKCDCGNIVKMKYNQLRSSTEVTSCGCLKLSRGEHKIKTILTENNILFEEQKQFNNCRFPDTKRLARFDFYLSEYNILIEYDGEQHFHQTGGWHNFNEIQKRDKYKNQWCKENNIPLIRINYQDYELLDYNYLRRKIDEIISS